MAQWPKRAPTQSPSEPFESMGMCLLSSPVFVLGLFLVVPMATSFFMGFVMQKGEVVRPSSSTSHLGGIDHDLLEFSAPNVFIIQRLEPDSVLHVVKGLL